MPFSLPTLGEAYYILEWIIRLAMLAILPFRRTPAATRSWLLLIFFLPVPGLLLFLVIGTPRFPRWRAERFERLRPFIADTARRLTQAAPEPDLHYDIAALATKLGRLPAVGGNAVELIADYDDVIARLVADIGRPDARQPGAGILLTSCCRVASASIATAAICSTPRMSG